MTGAVRNALPTGAYRRKKTALDVPRRNVTERVREVTMCIAPITHCPRPLGAKKTAPGIPRTVLQEPYLWIYMISVFHRYHINHTEAAADIPGGGKPFSAYLHRASQQTLGLKFQDTRIRLGPNEPKYKPEPDSDLRFLCTNGVFLCIMETDQAEGLPWYVRYYSRLFHFFN